MHDCSIRCSFRNDWHYFCWFVFFFFVSREKKKKKRFKQSLIDSFGVLLTLLHSSSKKKNLKFPHRKVFSPCNPDSGQWSLFESDWEFSWIFWAHQCPRQFNIINKYYLLLCIEIRTANTINVRFKGVRNHNQKWIENQRESNGGQLYTKNYFCSSLSAQSIPKMSCQTWMANTHWIYA